MDHVLGGTKGGSCYRVNLIGDNREIECAPVGQKPEVVEDFRLLFAFKAVDG
jgi:hypothetical protein